MLLQSAAFSGVFTGSVWRRTSRAGSLSGCYLPRASYRAGSSSAGVLAAMCRWLVVAVILTVVALAVGMNVGGGAVDLFGLSSSRCSSTSAAWAGGSPCAFGRSRPFCSCRCGLPRPLLRAGLRPARPPARVDRRRRVRQPRDLPARDRPRVHRRRRPARPRAFALAIGMGVAFWTWAFLGLRKAEAAGA